MTTEAIKMLETTESIHATVRAHYAAAAVRASAGGSCCSADGTIGSELYSVLDRSHGIPEGSEPFGVGALDRRRVDEVPVERPSGAREHRTGVTGVVADGDHNVEWLIEELRECLAPGARPVDP